MKTRSSQSSKKRKVPYENRDWTKTQDRVILDSKYGNQWTRLSKNIQLRKKTPDQIRKRYNTLIQKKKQLQPQLQPQTESQSLSVDEATELLDCLTSPKKQKQNPKLVMSDNTHQFLKKLWDILNNPDYNKIIRWSNDGTSFMIISKIKLQTEVFPDHFKHRNFNSFQRQLNYYGFCKTNKTTKKITFYQHPYFKREFPDDINKIIRKTENGKKLNPNFKKEIPKGLYMPAVTKKTLDNAFEGSSITFNGPFTLNLTMNGSDSIFSDSLIQ